MLTGIAATASWADGQFAAASLASVMTLNCFAVTIMGWLKCKSASFEKLDVFCLILALAAPILWYSFGSPGVAVLVVITVDVLAGVPTIYHAWRAPGEETLVEYIMAGLASCLTLAAASEVEVTSVAYPLYIIIFDLTVASLILRGRRQMAYNQKHEAITFISGDDQPND